MALKIYDTLAPQGDYPAVKAESVEMPDGTRLSDFKGGVSPTITVTAITGGHRVTIKDATGTKIFDVMDGEDGEDGQGASITVDSALSATSENPVQNKVIFEMAFQFSETLQLLQAAIPTDAHINDLIDAYLSEALGGDY